jgi:hypothetical protein
VSVACRRCTKMNRNISKHIKPCGEEIPSRTYSLLSMAAQKLHASKPLDSKAFMAALQYLIN